MKKIIFGLFIILCVSTIIGCDAPAPSARQVEKQKTDQLMAEANRQVGMPNITNFQEKKNMKMIMEQRDRSDAINHVYICAEMTGRLVYVGDCVGYPIPYSAQFTSPDVVSYANSYGVAVTAQADPNGLYMPTSASATWIMMIDPQTHKPTPGYFEPNMVVLTYLLAQ